MRALQPIHGVCWGNEEELQAKGRLSARTRAESAPPELAVYEAFNERLLYMPYSFTAAGYAGHAAASTLLTQPPRSTSRNASHAGSSPIRSWITSTRP